jgi:hypothetical protein
MAASDHVPIFLKTACILRGVHRWVHALAIANVPSQQIVGGQNARFTPTWRALQIYGPKQRGIVT